MKKINLLIVMVIACSCASAPPCRDVAEEPVSLCRAEKKCSVGAGTAFLIGMGGQAAIQNASFNKQMCISRELDIQKFNYYKDRD